MSFETLPLSVQILLGGIIPFVISIFFGNIVAAWIVGTIMALVPLYWFARFLMFIARALYEFATGTGRHMI